MPRRNESRCSRGERGFTLLELLITLALLGLLTLALFGSLRFGTRVWAASESTTETAEDIRDAQGQLAGIVASAYPKLLTPDASHAAVDFAGEPQSLRLLAPDASQPGAMAHTTIATREDPSGLALVVMREPELAAAPARISTQVLLTGVRNFALGYFGREKDEDKPAWHDSWREQTRLPSLVRIRVVLADRRVPWTDLVVVPQIAADVTCTFDLLTRFCQGR
jgi:general secretion pathway protein J